MKQPKLTNPLMAQRVMAYVNSQLTAKGWQLFTENAEVAAVANGVTKDQQTLGKLYTGFPGWRWSWAGDTMATTQVEHYTVGHAGD